MRKILTFILLFVSVITYAQKDLLQSGPMVGYSEMREVMLWVQTTKPADVKIMYTNKNGKDIKHWTNTVKTERYKANTAHLIADEVEPGQVYNYTVYINNKKVKLDFETSFQTLKLWLWRTDPPEINFATGSGAYINEPKYDRPPPPYGGDYEIYESIAKMKPDFMLWLGDNTYLRESDWNSRTGIQKRYTHTRSIKEMQPLLATVHNYAIWDDHDFGPNDSDRGFWNKNETLDAFKLFWANPSYGVGDTKGAFTFFNWGDCDFFMLDNRFYRTPDKRFEDNKTQLGKEQLEWLKDALVSSHATFKFIVMGGQFLTTSGAYEMYGNNGFERERAEIIEYIHDNRLNNVIFITGDRHHSEVSVFKRLNMPTIYDITVSPLTSHAAGITKGEVNPLRVENSLINKRNYAIFNIKGKKRKRVLQITFYDTFGKKLYDYSIKAVTYKRAKKKDKKNKKHKNNKNKNK